MYISFKAKLKNFKSADKFSEDRKWQHYGTFFLSKHTSRAQLNLPEICHIIPTGSLV